MTNIKDKISRRGFLKLMGGTAAAATAAMTGCKEKDLSTEDDYKNQVEPPKGKMTLLQNGKRVRYSVRDGKVKVTLPKGLKNETLAFKFKVKK